MKTQTPGKKDLNSSQSHYLKCFMVTQCSYVAIQPERIEIFILSGLSLSRPVDTKTEFILNNIIATLSLISISSVKKFAGKCPQTWSQLGSMNAKAGEHRRHLTSHSLRANVPVKSKLQHLPPGNPPGIWIFEKILFKFPPHRAEKLFKCPNP